VKLGIRESRIPVHLLNLLTLVNAKSRYISYRMTRAGFERLCGWTIAGGACGSLLFDWGKRGPCLISPHVAAFPSYAPSLYCTELSSADQRLLLVSYIIVLRSSIATVDVLLLLEKEVPDRLSALSITQGHRHTASLRQDVHIYHSKYSKIIA
jgi:hypothetical protein